MLLGLHQPDGGRLEVLGLDPVPRRARRCGPGSATPPSTTRSRPTSGPTTSSATSPRSTASPTGKPPAGPATRSVPGRPRRGALPPDRHDVDRPAPAGEAGPGHRPRPGRWSCSTSRPTASTRSSATRCWRSIRRVGTEFGINVLLSSHLLDEVERVCDGAVILPTAMVAASGSLAELRGTGEGLVLELDGDPAQQLACARRPAGRRR